MKNLELELELEVLQQNHSTFLSTARAITMREVKNLASGMREAIANIKKLSLDAKSGLDNEVSRALVNADKVRTFTRELSDANKEVEQFLGETGSNFPPSDGSTQPQDGTIAADKNGVIVNSEAK